MIGQVSSNIDGSYNVRYTPTVSGKHTVAVVQATVVETQIITTSFNTLKRGGIFSLTFDEYDFVSVISRLKCNNNNILIVLHNNPNIFTLHNRRPLASLI